MDDRIWTLLARSFVNEATPEELTELEELLAGDPALKAITQRMSEAWRQPAGSNMQKALDSFARIDAQIQRPTAPAVQHVVRELPVSPFKKYRLALTAAAACFLLIAGTWMILLNKNAGKEAVVLREIKASSNGIRQIRLPDGSMIWLNENSRIEYADAFNEKIREVWLTGEAYFDVVSNKEVPFVIHAGKINVRVLGTAFNIKSYPDEGSIETSLVRGSVEVTLIDAPGKKYILKPDQKLIIPVFDVKTADSVPVPDSAGREVRYAPLSHVAFTPADTIIAEVSWKDMKLAFYESSFRDLATRMERRYDVSFVFTDKAKEELVFTGVFYRQTLTEALHALALSAPFRYRIKDSTVFIY